MKKFTIHNKKVNVTFTQIGETLVLSPAFGKPDRWVDTANLTDEEKLQVVTTRPAPTQVSPNRTESLLPAEHTVTISDPNEGVHEQKVADMRTKRNKLIASTDFTQLADAPLTSPEKQAMREYRQALRDLPETITDIDNIVWPVKPEVQ